MRQILLFSLLTISIKPAPYTLYLVPFTLPLLPRLPPPILAATSPRLFPQRIRGQKKRHTRFRLLQGRPQSADLCNAGGCSCLQRRDKRVPAGLCSTHGRQLSFESEQRRSETLAVKCVVLKVRPHIVFGEHSRATQRRVEARNQLGGARIAAVALKHLAAHELQEGS